MTNLRIAVDAMGGDLGARATIPATLALASRYPNIHFQLYGEPAIKNALPSQHLLKNITFVVAEESVRMDDSPVHALRHKRDSSMAKAIRAVSEDKVSGCISAGNTGALVAIGLHELKTYEGIDRPALCKSLPTVGKPTYMLDLGANVDCSPAQLNQFACLGIALSQVLDDTATPIVKLLNVGSETQKGSSLVQETAALLQQKDKINYQGFIEADAIYQGNVDVIVSDGFAGNIALKASEGVARFVTSSFKRIFSGNIYTRIMALLSRPALRRWQTEMNPDRYNGAYLLGLRGTVVKSHGGASEHQFAYALEMLIQKLQKQNTRSMTDTLRIVMAE